MGDVSVFKFSTYVHYSKYCRWDDNDDKSPLKGTWSGSRDPL